MTGKLKHVTINLIDDNTPVISIVTDDSVFLKKLSNIREVCARGTISIVISNKEIEDKNICQKLILVPKVSEFIEPILVIIKCQLIAYYISKINE